MAVTVTHTQVNAVTPGALFSVEDTITASLNVSSALFVFAVEDDSFSHVASAADVQAFPDTKAAAILAGLGYYRAVSVLRTFSVLADAVEFGDLIDTRLKMLCVEQNALLVGFSGSTTSTVSS